VEINFYTQVVQSAHFLTWQKRDKLREDIVNSFEDNLGWGALLQGV
jgi:hypothetical protein